MKKIIRPLLLLAVCFGNAVAQDRTVPHQDTALLAAPDPKAKTLQFGDAFNQPPDDLKGCSFVLPSAEYRFDDHLKHGVFLGVKKVNTQKDCDCSSTLGALCFMAGPTYRAAVGYYPHTKTADVSLHYGYRYLFAYAEVGAGYSFGSKDLVPGQFFHFGPSVGIDFLVLQANAGYAFTTEKIYGKSGAFTLSIVISPVSFEGNKEYKKAVKAVNQSTATDRKSFRMNKAL